MVLRNQDLGIRSAHCCWGISIPRPSQGRECREYVNVYTYILCLCLFYLYLCLSKYIETTTEFILAFSLSIFVPPFFDSKTPGSSCNHFFNQYFCMWPVSCQCHCPSTQHPWQAAFTLLRLWHLYQAAAPVPCMATILTSPELQHPVLTCCCRSSVEIPSSKSPRPPLSPTA